MTADHLREERRKGVGTGHDPVSGERSLMRCVPTVSHPLHPIDQGQPLPGVVPPHDPCCARRWQPGTGYPGEERIAQPETRKVRQLCPAGHQRAIPEVNREHTAAGARRRAREQRARLGGEQARRRQRVIWGRRRAPQHPTESSGQTPVQQVMTGRKELPGGHAGIVPERTLRGHAMRASGAHGLDGQQRRERYRHREQDHQRSGRRPHVCVSTASAGAARASRRARACRRLYTK